MASTPDVLIVGGGVIGLSTAYFLARDGARVTVVDKGEPGQEASWAGAGILPPGDPAYASSPVDLLHAHSAALYPTLSAELRERTGIDNGYRRCGGIELVTTPETEATSEWRAEGVAFEHLDRNRLMRLEPALADGLAAGYYLPEMAQVRNPRHLKALLAACRELGVNVLAGRPAFHLERRNGRVTGLAAGTEVFGAGSFLLAAGAWTDTLLHPLGRRLGVHPVRGQIALLNAGSPVFHRIIVSGSRYLVPRADGRILIGSTEERVGFEKHTTAVAVAELLALACRLVPSLSRVPVERCWAGLRPGSPDGLPFLGPVPGYDNLYVAAGHFRSGLQLSPVTGLVMKELLLSQPLTVPLDAFRLDRGMPTTS